MAVLFSGDTGFFSGAQPLAQLLEGYEVAILPGISSLSYFCAKIQIPWQNVKIVSAHGRDHNAIGEVMANRQTFILTGGTNSPSDIIRGLCERGLSDARITVGSRLSYEDESIVKGSAQEFLGIDFPSLTVMLVDNPSPVAREYGSAGISDDLFIRDKVPMTKEEIRTLVVSKLKLRRGDIVWDVGAGTGSVSVECALATPDGEVYAIERNAEAVELIHQNAEKFDAGNIRVVPGTAPDVLYDLPPPHRLFIGGSSGNMRDIISAALDKNKNLRIVATAVSLETMGELLRLTEIFPITDVEIVQIAVTRTRRLGAYTMPDSQNPVWIYSGEVSND